MGKKMEKIPEEVFSFALPVRHKMYKLMELLIPLPCYEYGQATGDCWEFECLCIDGEEPLCRTRRLLADQLASAIQMNKYDPLHPEHKKLSRKEKDLILKAHELMLGDAAPLPETPRRGKV
ncbi:MAG: hypothetical protein A4E60_03469 [Syntrophorhabdus sp. PtaB.Bin047]|nr:MAG: hypothetical protein A4E60_03469 [Syntrophorhabdus sp. PtaB.Bin047]